MQKHNFEEFTAIWIATCELYSKQPSDAAIGMAFRALYRYDLNEIKRALDAHINDAGDGRFMPKPADIVKHIKGDPESRALRAWTLVETAIERTGPYQSVVFDEPEIMTAIEDLGGWIQLCKITDKELPFKRNEFVTRYRGYLNTPPSRHPPKLIGVHEAHNSRVEGAEIPSPILIGQPEKALLIHQQGTKKNQKMISVNDALEKMKIENNANKKV